MHARHVRRERAAAPAGDAHSPRQRRRIELVQLVLAEAPLALGMHPRARAHRLRVVQRHGHVAALEEVRVHALRGQETADLVHAREHLALQSTNAGAPAAAFVRARRPGEETGNPAAIATRGAEPGSLALQHQHAQGRIGGLQVVGRPQPGVAGPDDRHVGLGGSRQRRALGRWPADRPPPEAELTRAH